MSRVATDLLASSYGVTGDRVQVIPHGIPEMVAERPDACSRRAFGVAGPTHAADLRAARAQQGHRDRDPGAAGGDRRLPRSDLFRRRRNPPGRRPTPRRGLSDQPRAGGRAAGRARARGVSRPVRHQRPSCAATCRRPTSSSAPYQNEAQVTSGALSYAMGAGAAAVSTPYWHAQELLADGRGRLFPFGDSAALAKTLISLLGAAGRAGACPRRRLRAHPFHGVAACRPRRILRWQAQSWPRRHASPAGQFRTPAQQPARAAARSPAADDRRHRHHPARHLQRSAPGAPATASTTTPGR